MTEHELAALKAERDELRAILESLAPATRDILWCALVWNDHNFDHSDLYDAARRAAHALGYSDINAGVFGFNAWLARVRAAGVAL